MFVRYVLGFAFEGDQHESLNMPRFLLIRKKRGPANMAGHLNGLGGKLEEEETPKAGMIREFQEECGIDTSPYEWNHFRTAIYDPKHTGMHNWAKVYCFGIFLPQHVFRTAHTTTDELVVTMTIDTMMRQKHMANLAYLLPMAFTHLTQPSTRTMEAV